MIEGCGSGSITLTNGSGSGSRRPNNIRIRRIRDTLWNTRKTTEGWHTIHTVYCTVMFNKWNNYPTTSKRYKTPQSSEKGMAICFTRNKSLNILLKTKFWKIHRTKSRRRTRNNGSHLFHCSVATPWAVVFLPPPRSFCSLQKLTKATINKQESFKNCRPFVSAYNIFTILV